MRIIYITLLILNLLQCKHYFLRDTIKYDLTREEENILINKKIGVIGFRVWYIERCCSDKSYSLSQNLTRALQFIYQKKDSETIPINPNHFMLAYNKSERLLSSDTTAQSFFPYGKKLETVEAKPDKTIPEGNLRFFLKAYLDYSQHLGYSEIMEILDFSDKNKIYLKKNDFDYWVIGLHDIKHYSGINLTYALFYYSLGIFPFIAENQEESIIFIFDKKLNLIRKTELVNEYKVLAASWVFWQDPTGHNFIADPDFYSVIERINVNKPILKEFSKELAKIVKDTK